MASAGMVHGAKVYVPDENYVWLPAVVMAEESGGNAQKLLMKVTLPGGSTEDRVIDWGNKQFKELMKQHDLESLPYQNENLGELGVEDMISLNYLHEAAILHNVKRRFLNKLPYTYTGDICIAINPYQWLPEMYSEACQTQYLTQPKEELPPHVYATSFASYEHMRQNLRDQSILVSGESGAGKTETTKILMNHIATISGGMQNSTIQKIIEVNPLLESFGNASTIRNDNSSRFGKFTQLQFDTAGALVGAKCRTYLLEKTRVVHHEVGERNYHIFYQILSCKVASLSMGLDPSRSYKYLGSDEAQNMVGSSDATHFKRTKVALDLVGIRDKHQMLLFEILGGILHLGEMHIRPNPANDEESIIEQSDPAVAYVTKLFGLTFEDLKKSLCSRTMKTVNEVYSVPLGQQQAIDSRDALSKAVFSNLFNWLLSTINSSLSDDARSQTTIGVLDIFGFEHFKHNSFEQFCINYANEKLQQKFTEDVFKSVQVEYEEEGINWTHIDFLDNQDVLSIIESKMGIISLLNEELMRPKGNEESFMSKVASLHKEDNAHVIQFPRTSRTQFLIRHYAAPVTYECVGFLEKHKDALLPDLSKLMQMSSNTLLNKLFEDKPSKQHELGDRRKRGTLKMLTVGTQFKDSLGKLMTTIQATNVHYVRCIKPNAIKSPNDIDQQMVVSQLRCAGVIEAIRIARAAYPNRLLHDEFVDRFLLFIPPGGKNARDRCQALLDKLNLRSPDQYEMGKTRVYFQFGVLEDLESRRKKFLDEKATYIQTVMRGFIQRIEYLKAINAIIKLQSVARCIIAMRKYIILCKTDYAIKDIQRTFRGYICRCNYQEKRRSAVVIQSVVRMKIQRRKLSVAIQQNKLQADTMHQLQLLKEKLREEKMQVCTISDDKNRAIPSAAKVAATQGSDAGNIIERIQLENEELRRMNDDIKSQLESLKKTLEKAKADKEVASAVQHVKLRQLEDSIKEKDRRLEQLQRENATLCHRLKTVDFSETTRSRDKMNIFRTLGMKKEFFRSEDQGFYDSSESPVVDANRSEARGFPRFGTMRIGKPKFWSAGWPKASPNDLSSDRGEMSPVIDVATARQTIVKSVETGVTNLKGRMAAVRHVYDKTTGGLASSSPEIPIRESFNLDKLPEVPLPSSWETKVSRSTGRVYYVNRKLGKSQFERPTISSTRGTRNDR